MCVCVFMYQLFCFFFFHHCYLVHADCQWAQVFNTIIKTSSINYNYYFIILVTPAYINNYYQTDHLFQMFISSFTNNLIIIITCLLSLKSNWRKLFFCMITHLRSSSFISHQFYKDFWRIKTMSKNLNGRQHAVRKRQKNCISSFWTPLHALQRS